MEKPEPRSIRGLAQAAGFAEFALDQIRRCLGGDGLKIDIKSTAGAFDLRCFKAAVF